MPITIKIWLLCITTFGTFYQIAFSQQEQLKEEIEKIIFYDTKIADRDIPGFIIGIVDGDSTYHISFGTVKKGVDASPKENTIFEIGGLTKIFTAFLMNILSDEFDVDLETPFNNFIDSAFTNPVLKTISLKSLLTHTSGLPKLPNNIGTREVELHNRYANYTKEDLLRYYHGIPVNSGFGDFTYSHVNYALLEFAIEDITGGSYENALHKYILRPLKMKHTGLSLPDSTSNQMAQGYNKAGLKTGTWTFASFSSSEGIKSSAEDLTKMLSVLLNGSTDFSSIFIHSLDPYVKVPETKKTFVADAWHLFKNKKYNIYIHSGKTSGYAAFMAFVKETKTGVVLLTNSTHAMDGLGMLVLRLINDNWKRKANG